MKAKIVEGWPKGNNIRIILSETNAAQVNSLRRAILADVPKMAITKVRFEQGVTQDNKGEIIESRSVKDVLLYPSHDYKKKLTYSNSWIS